MNQMMPETTTTITSDCEEPQRSHRQSMVQQAFAATQQAPSPCLWISQRQVVANYQSLRESFPECPIFYALKCNPNHAVLETLLGCGSGFEIASMAELELMRQLEVPPEKMVCFHPIKSPAFLQALHADGIGVLAGDCHEELQKIATYAPGSRIAFRVQLPTTDCRFPLDRKFGSLLNGETLELFAQAESLGLFPVGLTIHVGSQCESVESWKNALSTYAEYCHQVTQQFPLQTVSLGGGLPCQYHCGNLTLNSFGAAWRELAVAEHFPAGCQFTLEPGRALVASAGVLIATVVGVAKRRGTNWAYLDAGVFHGLLEATSFAGNFRFPIYHERGLGTSSENHSYRIAGPTCDSLDVLEGVFDLPELEVGDRLAFDMLGAYSTSTSCTFNGFPIPVEQVEGM